MLEDTNSLDGADIIVIDLNYFYTLGNGTSTCSSFLKFWIEAPVIA